MSVTKQWSESRFKRGEYADDVYWIDAANETAATFASGLPQQNTSHPQDPRLLVQGSPDIRPLLPGSLYEATVHYIRLSTGGQQQQDDWRDMPIRVKWTVGNTTEDIDTDSDGKPLLNTVGDTFSGLKIELGTLFLTITRNESFFDIQKSLAFQNHVNNNDFTIQSPLGPLTIQAFQCLCHSIGPESEYAVNAEYIPISYDFELRKDGFDFRILDQGDNGKYSDGGVKKIGRFTDGKTDFVSSVRLNIGKPIDTTITVGGSAVVAGKVPDWALKYDGGDDAKFIYYKRYPDISFSGLGL